MFSATPQNLDKDGRFDQAGVVPGSYWLQAFDMSEVGVRVPVEVTDHDVEGVVFTDVYPVDIEGHARFDDDAPHDLSKVLVRLRRLDTDFP